LKEVVNRLHSELKSITALPEIRERFTGMGLIPIDSPAVEGLQAYVNSEIARWGRIIQQAGIAGAE